MGVHDYRCSVCGTPGTYQCGEKRGTACEQTGIGEDRAVLELFFFAAEEAPDSPEAFEEALGRARRVETRPFGYDWGDWEFVPSLNYRELLMDSEDEQGLWPIQPFEAATSDGSPVSLQVAPDERVWVVNYCPPCRALFVDREPSADEPCIEYLRAVADQLGMELKDGAAKAAFIEAVRDRVARRRPAKG